MPNVQMCPSISVSHAHAHPSALTVSAPRSPQLKAIWLHQQLAHYGPCSDPVPPLHVPLAEVPLHPRPLPALMMTYE